jgi:hypothetical protein
MRRKKSRKTTKPWEFYFVSGSRVLSHPCDLRQHYLSKHIYTYVHTETVKFINIANGIYLGIELFPCLIWNNVRYCWTTPMKLGKTHLHLPPKKTAIHILSFWTTWLYHITIPDVSRVRLMGFKIALYHYTYMLWKNEMSPFIIFLSYT